MVNILGFELLVLLVTSGFFSIDIVLFFLSQFNFINYILVSSVFSLEISSSQVIDSALVNTLFVEGIVHV
jgi:hypothetical protein